MTVPTSLALSSVADSATIIAVQHRNNYSAIQSAVNSVIGFLTGAADGAALTFSSGTGNWAPSTGLVFGANAITAKSGSSVADFQTGTVTIAAGTEVFKVDSKGNVLIGPNTNVASPAGSDSRYIGDFLYAADKRRLYLRSLIVTELGDPPDIAIGRTGGTYPATGPTQLLSGSGIGAIYWRAWTDLGDFQGRTAQIDARLLENATHTACGGDLRFSTTPLGAAVGVLAAVIDSDGTFMLGANKDTWMRRDSIDLIKLTNGINVEKGGMWAPGGFIGASIAGVPVDGNFRAGFLQTGLTAYDSTNERWYVRNSGGVWKYVPFGILDLANTWTASQTHADATNISFGTTNGTKIGTATTQKIGFFNKAPVAQPSTTGETVGFTTGAGTAVKDDSTFTGNVGATAYRLSDIVKHLKNLGLIAT